MAALTQAGEVQGEILLAPLTPLDFVRKWGKASVAHGLNEEQGSHQHFLELCDMLKVPRPVGDQEVYTFEKSFPGLNGSVRFADVWKRGSFAWEYKRPGKNLSDALEQLLRYAFRLDNPPLLVVTDRDCYEIHTHFTGYPTRCTEFEHQQLVDPKVRAQLRAVFQDPYSFKPTHDSKHVTESVAATFATIADVLRVAGTPPHEAAHFLCQCVFCYFAEDIGLMKNRPFKRVVTGRLKPEQLRSQLTKLFDDMREGGFFGADEIPWFNGGLFNTIAVPRMPATAIAVLARVADLDWSAIDPGIFGTLFQRGLDPSRRSQLGAFYTNPSIIQRLVEPVVQAPLLREWDQRAREINGLLSARDMRDIQAQHTSDGTKRSRVRSGAKRAEKSAQDIFNLFLERLRDFRVLDPACGSGNFLYLALKAIKDVEKQVHADADALGLRWQFAVTGVQNVLGIEVDEYAAELARMTVWIGELQWRKQNGYGWKTDPILEKLEHIECRDAVLQRDQRGRWQEASWPAADVIVGNPPFIGNKKMREELGDEYTEALRREYGQALSGGVDFVCYWFHKALEAINSGKATAAGLVSTQALRRGANRAVLDAICAKSRIFQAWSDEPWVNEGAGVRVSLVCFGQEDDRPAVLDGHEVQRIAADLSGGAQVDLTKAVLLKENAGVAFQGPVKVGQFDVPGRLAREWLASPNVNGRSNAEVLRPWANGQDLAARSSDTWIIDFGADMTEEKASQFEKPFAHVLKHVKPMREAGNRESRKKYWWLHGETVPGLRSRLQGLRRYLATPRVSKHRFFVWLPMQVWPDSRLYAITRDDDFTFGVLSSRIHLVWALANASRHGDGDEGGRPTYNAKSCFETFPFPIIATKQGEGARAAVESCAQELDRLRAAWLNPPEWTQQVYEVIPLGYRRSPYPQRSIPKKGFERRLADRTLTKLYNEPPPWLQKMERALDQTVARAYGWADYSPALPDAEILARIADLNRRRASA
jgi:methylase of polypeptide subunit release factors